MMVCPWGAAKYTPAYARRLLRMIDDRDAFDEKNELSDVFLLCYHPYM